MKMNEGDALKRGDDLEASERFNDAEEHYRVYIQLFPRSAKLYARRGRCLFLLKRYQEAVSLFKEALAIKPNAPTALYMLGESHEQLGELNEALRAYQLSAETKPQADVFISMGLIHKYQGQYELARKAFSQAKSCAPNDQHIEDLLASVNDK